MAVDPAAESIDLLDPQSWNRYTYVKNNPLVLIDPRGLKDKRTDEDKKVLDDPDVKQRTQEAWEESNPDARDGDDMQEVGFNTTETSDGEVNAKGTETQGNPRNVNLTDPDENGEIDGEKAGPTVHTHPAGGRWVTNPETGKRQKGKHSHSADDKDNVRDSGRTSYVVSRKGIYRYGPGDKRPKKVLSGKHFKEYMGKKK